MDSASDDTTLFGFASPKNQQSKPQLQKVCLLNLTLKQTPASKVHHITGDSNSTKDIENALVSPRDYFFKSNLCSTSGVL